MKLFKEPIKLESDLKRRFRFFFGPVPCCYTYNDGTAYVCQKHWGGVPFGERRISYLRDETSKLSSLPALDGESSGL